MVTIENGKRRDLSPPSPDTSSIVFSSLLPSEFITLLRSHPVDNFFIPLQRGRFSKSAAYQDHNWEDLYFIEVRESALQGFSKNAEREIFIFFRQAQAIIAYWQSSNELPEDERQQLEEIEQWLIKTKENIVNASRFLVLSIAEKYQESWVEKIDIYQAGHVGLLKAIDSEYDPAQQYRFSTIASRHICNEIDAMLTQLLPLRLPRAMFSQLKVITFLASQEEQRLGRTLLPEGLEELIAKKYPQNKKSLNLAGKLEGHQYRLSKASSVDDSEQRRNYPNSRPRAADKVRKVEEIVFKRINVQKIHEFLESLYNQGVVERQDLTRMVLIFCLYHGITLRCLPREYKEVIKDTESITTRDLAEHFDISPVRVSQILQDANAKLTRFLIAEGIIDPPEIKEGNHVEH